MIIFSLVLLLSFCSSLFSSFFLPLILSISLSLSYSLFLSLYLFLSLFFSPLSALITELDSVKAQLVSAQQTSADLAAASIRQEKVMADERTRAQASLSEVSTSVDNIYNCKSLLVTRSFQISVSVFLLHSFSFPTQIFSYSIFF